MKRLPIVTVAFLLAACGVLSACGGPRLLMRDATSREITAPPQGLARVVFAVPGAQRDVISVVDERGRYVGQLGGRTFFVAEAAPGAHRWYALVGASSYVVGGTVEAGRTYWILADTAFARPMRWIAWAPACGEDTAARIADARAIEPDPQADSGGLLIRQLGDVPQRILEADRELSEMTDAQQAERVLAAACVEAAAGAGAEAGAAAEAGGEAEAGAEAEPVAEPSPAPGSP